MSKKIDPRVKRTRLMIEEALLKLMEEKDYKDISVQEIAKESTLHRGTFYLHYFDKEDLLEQLLDNALYDLKCSVQVKEIEYTYESNHPHPAFIRLFEKLTERPRFYQIMLAKEKINSFTESVRIIIETFVEDAINHMIKDNIENKVPQDISIAYITSAFLGVVIWWLNNDMPHSPNYMATQLTTMSTVGPFVKNPYLK